MSEYWSELVRGLKPYVPGEQPQGRTFIKLNTNENPYPPSPEVVQAIRDVSPEALRLYPDPDCGELKRALGEYFGLSAGHVFVGNGSDEVLALAFMAFFKGNSPLLFPDITYSFYPVYCSLLEIEHRIVPLNDDFRIESGDYLAQNGGIIFPNPNAPTGRFLPVRDIEALLQRTRGSVVVVDEAYVDFGGESCVPLIESYTNLLVVQTLSKSRSLAGLRVGFALGATELVEGLERVKNSFNSYPLDRLALAGAVAAIRDNQYFEKTCKRIIETREWTSDQLKKLGFDVIPSRANFVCIRHEKRAAKDLFSRLREAGVLVRYFEKPRIDNHLRVTIGTDEEMEEFVRHLQGILEKA